MAEKVTIGNCELWHGDCVEYMRTLPDFAFDLAITDPPYAVGASNGSFGRGGARSVVQDYRTDMKHYANNNTPPGADYFEQLFRVSRHQIIWGANYYPEFLTHSGWIVWDKVKTDGLLSEAELAFQSFNKLVNIFRHPWEGFKKGAGSFEPTSKQTIHPNQKPVRLYEWLLTKYATQGQRILDTHLGSGSSAIAAAALGFKFVGCELDDEYFAKACKRITDAQAQPRLFEDAKVGAGETAVQGDMLLPANDRVEGRDAALSRRVPSHDGLEG